VNQSAASYTYLEEEGRAEEDEWPAATYVPVGGGRKMLKLTARWQ
jgi:hypothetical protein